MAKRSGLGSIALIGGNDLSGDINALDRIEITHNTHTNQGIDKSGIEREYLQATGGLAFSSWFNDATAQAHDRLSLVPSGDVLAIYAPSSTRGDPAFMIVGKQTDYPVTRPSDGSLATGGTVEGTLGIAPEWGVLISAGVETHASAGSKASVDNGASSASGAAAMLQIDDIGSGTPTFVLEDSANDSSFATLISFAAVADGAEPAAERKTVAGTVDRYARVTTTGSFANADAVVAMRRGTAQDAAAYT